MGNNAGLGCSKMKNDDGGRIALNTTTNAKIEMCGLNCSFPTTGMPVPMYSTPRKQCIPNHPLCGLAFTCLMDVHALDADGKPVENWWMMDTVAADGVADRRRQFHPHPPHPSSSFSRATAAGQSPAANGILGILGLG